MACKNCGRAETDCRAHYHGSRGHAVPLAALEDCETHAKRTKVCERCGGPCDSVQGGFREGPGIMEMFSPTALQIAQELNCRDRQIAKLMKRIEALEERNAAPEVK